VKGCLSVIAEMWALLIVAAVLAILMVRDLVKDVTDR
jgi:hypothetical protein